jgi:hypothetical protein
MATVFHQIQYWTYTIAPGSSLWLSYGPDDKYKDGPYDKYKDGTVQVTCCASTSVGGQIFTQTISVPEVFITSVPLISGGLVFNSYYAGFNVTNRGQNTINFFSVALTVINP